MKIVCNTLLLGCLMAMLTSCIRTGNPNEAIQQIMERETAYRERTRAEQSNVLSGSLWNRAGNLYEDPKARRVNDILTVLVIEEASGKKEAKTSLSKSSTLKATISGLFGLETRIPEDYPSIDMSNLINTETSSQFDGSGSTSRKGALTATVSVIVTNVLANGNLVISGKQSVRINNEEQIVSVEGIVRPVDVKTDNTIESPKIANAHIVYEGNGVLADKQYPGWGIRVFDKVWPF